MLLQTISVFRYTLPVLKIYSSRYIYYRFSVLTVYIGTRPSFGFFSLPSCENSHDQHCKKPTIANRLNVTRKIATSGDAATVVCLSFGFGRNSKRHTFSYAFTPQLQLCNSSLL